MIPADFRAPYFRNHWVRVKQNSNASVIPPFSLVYIASESVVDNEIVYAVAKPNSASTDFNRDYLVTGPLAIDSAAGAEGIASSLEGGGYVSYDGTGTPSLNEVWGPKHGQHTLSKNQYGFLIRGGNTTFNGVNITIARQIGVNSVAGKLDTGTVGKNSTCTVSVWDGARASAVGAKLLNVKNPAISMTSVTTKQCIVVWNAGNPELVLVECD